MKSIFDARIREAAKSLVTKGGIQNALKLGNEITEEISDVWFKYFLAESHFDDDRTQNYLVFQPVFRYFTMPNGNNRVLTWKCKGLSEERIRYPAVSNKLIVFLLKWFSIILKYE